MRWLASLFFVLALGLMGCSETSGTGGVGGDGGNGGVGGGVVSGCTGEEDFTECGTAGEGRVCFEEQCVAGDCSEVPAGSVCVTGMFAVFRLGVCVDDACAIPVEDCSGVEDGA